MEATSFSFAVLPTDLQLCVLHEWVAEQDDFSQLLVLSSLDVVCSSKGLRAAVAGLIHTQCLWSSTKGANPFSSKDRLVGCFHWLQSKGIAMTAITVDAQNMRTVQELMDHEVGQHINTMIVAGSGRFVECYVKAIRRLIGCCPNLVSLQQIPALTHCTSLAKTYRRMQSPYSFWSVPEYDYDYKAVAVPLSTVLSDDGRCNTLHRLQHLDFSCLVLTEYSTEFALLQCGQLRKLTCSSREQEHVSALLDLIRGLAQLEELSVSLGWSTHPAGLLLAMLAAAKEAKLKAVAVRNIPAKMLFRLPPPHGEQSDTLLAAILEQTAWLKNLSLHCGLFDYSRVARSLKLAQNCVSPSSLQAILAAFPAVQSLHLIINVDDSTESTLRSIGQAHGPTLETLTVEFSASAVEQLCKLLTWCLKLKNIRMINLPVHDGQAEQLALAMRQVEDLDFGLGCERSEGLEITDIGIAHFLQHCPTLKALHIPNAPHVTVATLQAAVKRGLRMSWNEQTGITDSDKHAMRNLAKQEELLPVLCYDDRDGEAPAYPVQYDRKRLNWACYY